MGIKHNIADRIQRGLDRELDAIENDDFMSPEEKAAATRELERDARWAYQEECERAFSDSDYHE